MFVFRELPFSKPFFKSPGYAAHVISPWVFVQEGFFMLFDVKVENYIKKIEIQFSGIFITFEGCK